MEIGQPDEFADLAMARRVAEVLRPRLHKRGLAICLSGIDGSGKSTLARKLVNAFEADDVPVHYLHIHQWYQNAAITPIILLYNRYFGRKVLVFDRSIYDNLAVISVRQYWPRWLSRVGLAMVSGFYPRFDHCFYLFIGFAETLSRRPDTEEERFALLNNVYDEIVRQVQCLRLKSDEHLFPAVLEKIMRAT